MSDNILATRKHKILDIRSENLRLNILAYNGGAPYILERLNRYPSESDVDFYGDTGAIVSETRFLNNGTTRTVGRQQRAFLNNYARRITTKINQYVFQTEPTRKDIDCEWEADVTRTGKSLNQFMSEVSDMLTVSRWCWIGVDRPASAGPRSKAEVEASGDRVYWQLYAANEVIDWSFDSHGKLCWLLLERDDYDNANPRVAATKIRVRYLYEPGKVTKMVFNDKKSDFDSVTVTPINYPGIPFVAVGTPSDLPWWFDDVERIQSSIMDLHSSLDTSIFKTVFPVLVISQGFADDIKSDKITADQARRKIGTGNPIVESSEEKGTTRWLSGTTPDLEFIRAEIDRRQADLFDIVGLAMKTPQTRQVASAASKEWDHLDTEAVLAERATILEESEEKCIEMSKAIGGPIFTPYTVAYARKFDLSDFVEDIKAITLATGMTMPPEAEKMLVKAALRSAGKRFNISESEITEVTDAVDNYEPPPPPTYTPPIVDPNAPPKNPMPGMA